MFLMGQAARLFALHAYAQRTRCGLLSTRQPLDQLALPPGELLPGSCLGRTHSLYRPGHNNIRKILRLDDLFQCRPAADDQRCTFQLHQLFLLELGE
jgi:hypothetical protein